MCRNPTTPTMNHKNKLESVSLVDKYFVVGVTAIPYHGFGVIIKIVSKNGISYQLTMYERRHPPMYERGLCQTPSHALGKRMIVLQRPLLCV